jgi:serine/threonine protein kinase
VVQRDLKPLNILLDEFLRVMIVDFGLALRIGEDSRMTPPGQFVGTPVYSSPEQLNGEEVDHRCDLWALSIMLYEMITSDVPFYSAA